MIKRFNNFDNGVKLIAIAVLVVMALSSVACLGKVTPSQASTSASSASQSVVKKDGSPVFLCGALTKKGTPCKNHVKKQGDRCHLHLGKPSA